MQQKGRRSAGREQTAALVCAQAGADVEALKNVAVEQAASDEVITMKADVVVVGGGAGLAAAVAASEKGASVILIEKTDALGGNRLGGNAISECLTTGRTAGANAADGK